MTTINFFTEQKAVWQATTIAAGPAPDYIRPQIDE
jgi:hypothetical protein